MATAPNPAQYYAALDVSKQVRGLRVELKRRLQDGTLCPLAVIRDPPWYTQTMRVFELLEYAPRVGQRRLHRINIKLALGMPAVNLFSSLGELTERQKETIIAAAFPHGALQPIRR